MENEKVVKEVELSNDHYQCRNTIIGRRQITFYLKPHASMSDPAFECLDEFNRMILKLALNYIINLRRRVILPHHIHKAIYRAAFTLNQDENKMWEIIKK